VNALLRTSYTLQCVGRSEQAFTRVTKKNSTYYFTITSTKRRINRVVSPDDGPIVAQNMYRLININILKTNFAQSWFYLQDYTETHGQQNIKNTNFCTAVIYQSN